MVSSPRSSANSRAAPQMPPDWTDTRVTLASASTVKSVPRTPMAAMGVLKRNFSRAALAACPETWRATPLSSVYLTCESCGRSAS